MIADALLGIVYTILNFLTGLLPSTTLDNALSGLPAVGTFLNQVVGTTKAFVPWDDMFIMIGILLTITGIRLTMQVINLIWP